MLNTLVWVFVLASTNLFPVLCQEEERLALVGERYNPELIFTHPETCWPLASGLVDTTKIVSLEFNRTAEKEAAKLVTELERSGLFEKAVSILERNFQGSQLSQSVEEAEKIFGPLSEEATKEYKEALRGSTTLSLSKESALTRADSDATNTRASRTKRQVIAAPATAIVTPLSPFWFWLFPCGNFFNLLFRTADGSCNHIFNYGQSLKPLTRCLSNAYDDGLQHPRTLAVSGSPLPGARLVSRNVHPDKVATSGLTTFVMLWGQFTDHDVVSTPLPVQSPYTPLQCCGPNGGPPPPFTSSECFPIRFPAGDPNFHGTCMDFFRSAPVTNAFNNIILPRENENAITSFVDASNVYGSTQAKQSLLRHPTQSHLLRTTTDNFPPDNGLNDCVKRNNLDICFLAGDDRANENPGLALLHTIFVRYHNHLATQLKAVSPFSSNEVVFQQVRAIVAAVMQNILYSDWLPIVLGPTVRAQFDLDLPAGVRSTYDFTEDPRIFQSFSTAAFRFGHSLIPRSMLIEPGRRELLRNLFFTPYETRDHLDSLAQGLLQAPDPEDRSQPADRHLVEDLTGHLFENQEGHGEGFDLAALNIQRGRDHGLPSYNAFRQKCGLASVTTFCSPTLGNGGAALSNAYDHVDDIDLFAGGTSEPAHDGGLVGETFSHLLAKQFHSLKFGDRFFFTHKKFLFGFTDSQVNLLKGIHLSHVLCLTTGISSVQQNPFRVPGFGNPTQSCATLNAQHPSMNNFRYYPLF